jgi:hypothetical protein
MAVCRNQTAPFASASAQRDDDPVHVKDYNGRKYNYQQNNLDRWLKRESGQNRPPSGLQESATEQESWEYRTARKHGLLLPVNPDSSSGDQEVDNRTPEEVRLAEALGAVAKAQPDDHVFATIGDETHTHIGAGSRGVVFAGKDNSYVVKIHTKGFATIQNEAHKLGIIFDTLSKYPSSRIRVPRFWVLLLLDEEAMTVAVPEQYKWYCDFPTGAMKTDRILPLRKDIRDGLIQAYALPKMRNDMSRNRRNVDCLIHLYLGNCSSGPGSISGLRDFKMNLTMMEKLRLPFEEYANSMGQALAAIHWYGGLDARGIKFVLGTAHIVPPERLGDIPNDWEQIRRDLKERNGPCFLRTDMFCLDCDLVEQLCNCGEVCDCNNRKWVDKVVEAFKASPPYFPRPNSANPAASLAWNAFVMGYLESTRKVGAEEPEAVEFAVQFLESVMRECTPCTPDDVMKDDSNPGEDYYWPGDQPEEPSVEKGEDSSNGEDQLNQ